MAAAVNYHQSCGALLFPGSQILSRKCFWLSCDRGQSLGKTTAVRRLVFVAWASARAPQELAIQRITNTKGRYYFSKGFIERNEGLHGLKPAKAYATKCMNPCAKPSMNLEQLAGSLIEFVWCSRQVGFSLASTV